MDDKGKWLKANTEGEEAKAVRKRLGKEGSLREAVEAVDNMQARKRQPAPPTNKPYTIESEPAARTEPQLIDEGADPEVIDERTVPGEAASPPTPAPKTAKPDQQLVELAQLWPRLSPRDQLELLMLARLKVHLNEKRG